MAYFRCGQGAGTPLKIEITTEESSLFGGTITISKSGATVGTTTFDNAGEAEYEVDEAGQYTVSCGGYSATVDVSDEFPVEIITTKTVTVTIYSAASDTVSFTDATGAKTATTDTSGAAANVSITFSPLNPSITFTSSVAKNPSNLSAYYSKTVTLTDNMTEVYVMPSNILYWYGYKSSVFEECSSATGWSVSGGYSINSPSDSTNYIEIRTSNDDFRLVAGLVAPTSGKKLKAITTVNVANTRGLAIYIATNKVITPDPIVQFNTAYSEPTLLEYTYTSDYQYYIFGSDYSTGRGGKLYALWYE